MVCYSTPQEFQEENIEITETNAENIQRNRTRPSYSAIEIRERLCQYLVKALSHMDRYRGKTITYTV